MGCYVAAGVTGAHLNPAVTLALAVHRQFPWSKVLPYVARADRRRVRRLGRRLRHLPRGADGVRRRRAPGARAAGHRRHLGDLPAAVPQHVPRRLHRSGRRHGAAGRRDLRHHRQRGTRPRPPASRRSSSACWSWLIGATFGFNSGYAINPARDFGPRLFTFVGGWGSEVFRAGNDWWWVPIVAPCVGAVIGGWVYDALIGHRFPSHPG